MSGTTTEPRASGSHRSDQAVRQLHNADESAYVARHPSEACCL